ncbi:hypothetical protein AQJ91_35220 [Streptomyces dysideae]|uniref:Uncharacterized protein n=1 Tax=Streptomyces dysideae TaxID=909626 RepID=A0A101UTJ9_9ACTN|nr:hypothetical protein AQJ91_35220 [Streptomyces dysideae]
MVSGSSTVCGSLARAFLGSMWVRNPPCGLRFSTRVRRLNSTSSAVSRHPSLKVTPFLIRTVQSVASALGPKGCALPPGRRAARHAEMWH